MVLTFTADSRVEILLRRELLASTRTSEFDLRFGLPRLLWSSTCTSGFDSNSGEISDFELQGLRLLRSSPSGFDACFGLACALRRVPSALALALLAGAGLGPWRAPEPGADGKPPAAAFARAALLSINPVIPWFTVATVMLNFVGNRRCSRALDWSAKAVCWAEAGFRVKQTIINHFYVILHHYFLLCPHCPETKNGSVITYHNIIFSYYIIIHCYSGITTSLLGQLLRIDKTVITSILLLLR